MRRLLVVDLFSGAGGFSRGFEDSGFFMTRIAIDCDRSAARSFKTNFPQAAVLAENIKDIDGSDIRYLCGCSPEIVIGSPPCEPFTGANPRRERDPLDRLYKDPMGTLTLDFIRIVGELKPRIFVMENVPAIMDGPLKQALITEFRAAGFSKVFFNVLRAEDYGTPSHRKRVFISNVEIRPRPRRKRVTVEEALRNLPPPGLVEIPNHDPVPLSDRKLRRIAAIRRGRALYYYEGATRRLPNYIKLDPRRVAPTVLGSSRFIHPYENRLLTVREQARLMGFPDDHVFLGGRDEQFNQVGEAVPPPLAKAIALYLVERYLR
ncbi:MAG: DNA cytosine methyltransferase [Crenarchaeota archaeon]|nr:DNA cytosine methyltransferase [Thermoproteota archaeon]